MTPKIKPKSGFTFIEILIVAGILLMVAALGFESLSQFKKTRELDAAARRIVDALRLQQSRTLAAESDSRFGVHFETDRIVLFQGSSYDAASTTNEIILVPTPASIGPVALASGGNEVIFERLTGRAEATGSITLTAEDLARVITIDAAGQVRTEAEALPAAGARIVDSRHVNFDLGWSIQNATTLRLVFANPPASDVTENVALADVCSGSPRSVCDWSGTINVSEAREALRVHTVSLTATGTVLSVDRDLRTNIKALAIYIIDGEVAKDIAYYTAAGTTTAGAFGGTMIVQ